MGSGRAPGSRELQFSGKRTWLLDYAGESEPDQCEALTMVCAQVLGNDVAVNVGGASEEFRAQRSSSR